MPKPDDEPPPTPTPTTRKSSGTLAIFESVCTEAIVRLGVLDLGDDRGIDLQHEARELATIFGAWRTRRPTAEDRASAVARVMELHRGVDAWAAARRDTPTEPFGG